ncbi:hypothetical protein Hs30E_19260 [Lactococcus hodotermopsidis]|uniref:Uncharacterized protein n=1 Tax=Pseudolactococcus hodotermopsidis TaxID=2709157 RepID=A0A6A0BFA0_9LACT|nr:hypothetical protein [Lactococcus hodotermopsidis]GFH43375.1 hypothetical protein Hs30E_19260 [Lactococcus hodotermopsidis]
MLNLIVVIIVGAIAYFTLDKRERRIPRWLKIVFWLIVLGLIVAISEELGGIVVLGLLVWWFVRRTSRKKARVTVAKREKEVISDEPDKPQSTYQHLQNPISRYVSTPKRRAALADLESTPKELAGYIHQEIDTFFMNEWTKMAAIYSDETGRFDTDVRDNAARQMREILDAIFAKFAKVKRAELVEKQSINEELKAKHKEEIDIAMQVYEKWQDKS